MEQGFECHICGKHHKELPMTYGANAPYDWDVIEHEDDEKCLLTDDICIINACYYYIRGCIEIPIHDRDDFFLWGVWVSIKKENMNLHLDNWENDKREQILEPMFGWLSTEIPGYPSTHQLKTMVYTRKPGTRPCIELEATEHPLAVEQHEGISIERVKEIVALMLHDN